MSEQSSQLRIRSLSDDTAIMLSVTGDELNARRAQFEAHLCNLGLMDDQALVCAPSMEPHVWHLLSGASASAEPVSPHSVTLATALIEGGHVPEGWKCGVLALTNTDTYLTICDDRAILTRVRLHCEISGIPEALSRAVRNLSKGLLNDHRTFDAIFVPTAISEETQSRIADSIKTLVEQFPWELSEGLRTGIAALTKRNA